MELPEGYSMEMEGDEKTRILRKNGVIIFVAPPNCTEERIMEIVRQTK